MAAKSVEIRLLGRFEVLHGNAHRVAPVELPPSKKARALLAYLVATGRGHDRDHLAGILWDEREDARAALRWALSRLRPVVDSEKVIRLVNDRDRVAFERRDALVDLHSVRHALREGIDRASTEALEQAAAQFRGEFLDGLDLSDCYGFHAWHIAEREAARSLRASILSTIVARLTDEPERALPFARARLDLDPLAGAAQASVVRILGALGRQREAEELYQSLKQMVQTRLGERASVELERARVAVRTTAAPSPPVVVTTPTPATTTPPLARLARSPFVGRQRELASLTSILDAAVAGDGGAFVEIAGEAGIGKSRLIEELVHQTRLRGARALIGRCLEGDGSPAFLPFLDSLDAALADESDFERLVGDDVGLAARLFPRLAARLQPATAVAASPDAVSDRYLVFQAVATLLERIAAPAGALLVIEDLHWADQPSLALLRYLAGRLEGARLLVVATYRDEDLVARHRDVLVELRRQGQATTSSSRVVLRGLADDEAADLVTAALGGVATDTPSSSSTLRTRLTSMTGGHPLFLQEMLKHLVEENALDRDRLDLDALSVPEGVRQVIGRRLARLSERARRLLTIASPMIGAFRWDLVREVSNETEDDLLDALEEVLAAQLLREDVAAGQVTYELSHRLVAQTLVESLPIPRRVRLNLQIGEAIERLHKTNLDAHVAALAHHFFIAAADDATKAKAVDYALRAAERAASLVAFEEAARHYQRAATLIDGLTSNQSVRAADIHRQRGRALAIVSAWNEACEAFELALTSADADAREWRAEVLVELGNASLWAMNMPAVHTRALAAEDLVRELGRDDLTVAVGGMVAQCLASEGKVTSAIEKYKQIWSLRKKEHVPSLSLAPLTLYWNGRVSDSIQWANENLVAARAADDIVSLLVGLPPLGMALAASGRYREAKAAFEEARAIGERARATSLLARAVSMSTGFHLDLDDLDAAEDLAGEARDLARTARWSPGDVSAAIDLVACRIRRDDIGAAETLIKESEQSAAEISGRKPGASGFHGWLWSIRLAWARAEVSAARGKADEVERWAAEALGLATGGRPKYEVATLVTRAHSRAKQGRTEAALADLDRALASARAINDPTLTLRAARPRLVLEGSEALAAEIRTLEASIATPR